jgi:hypothetical protein
MFVYRHVKVSVLEARTANMFSTAIIQTWFWLIGANAPIMKIDFKYILKNSNNLNKKFPVCI